MAITIKRSTLSLKKLNETSVERTSAAPHLTSGPVWATPSEPAPAWTMYAIAGLIGMLFMVGVILLQYLEYAHYQDAFPLRTPQAAAVTAPKQGEKPEPAASKSAVEAQTVKPSADKTVEPTAETPAPAVPPAPVATAVEE